MSNSGFRGAHRESTRLEGDIRSADLHLIGWVAGPDLLPDESKFNSYLELLDAQTGITSATDPQARAALEQRAVKSSSDGYRVVGKYVPDPGKHTEYGMRSVAWHPKDQLLAGESRPELLPSIYLEDSPLPGGVARVSTDRFYSSTIHHQEIQKIWKRVWQMACHEDDIPNVGDYSVYEIADLSFLIVRVDDTQVKAYYNSCLHRGQQLRETDGIGAKDFRCAYHGWCWNLDGTMKDMTASWDFGGISPSELSLPEVRVARWGGFVFVNLDNDAEPLEDFLGKEMLQQFEKFHLEKRYKSAQVAMVLDANWKVAADVFREGWHLIATHPQQLLAGTDGGDIHYDVFGNFGRGMTLSLGGVSPSRGVVKSADEIAETRRHAATQARTALEQIIGDEVDTYSDTELLDTYFTDVFPNLHPGSGWSRTVYRFRPMGNNPEQSIMEVFLVSPWPSDAPKPPAAGIRWVKQSWAEAPELGGLAMLLDQDVSNISKIQHGMKSRADGNILLSEYNESKIRNFHRIYDEWMGR